jgi:hypothetical protein
MDDDAPRVVTINALPSAESLRKALAKDPIVRFWQQARDRNRPDPMTNPDPHVTVPLSLLLALKEQIEKDAVELESTTRWCRSLEALKDQNALPVTWDRLVALLKEQGHAV